MRARTSSSSSRCFRRWQRCSRMWGRASRNSWVSVAHVRADRQTWRLDSAARHPCSSSPAVRLPLATNLMRNPLLSCDSVQVPNLSLWRRSSWIRRAAWCCLHPRGIISTSLPCSPTSPHRTILATSCRRRLTAPKVSITASGLALRHCDAPGPPAFNRLGRSGTGACCASYPRTDDPARASALLRSALWLFARVCASPCR